MGNLITRLFGTRKQKYSEPKLYEMHLSRQRATVGDAAKRLWEALRTQRQHTLFFGEFRAINMLKRGYLAYAVAAIGVLGGCSKDNDKPKPDPTKSGISVVYNNDADLWGNTATVSVKNNAKGEEFSVQYRVKGSQVWTNAVKVDKDRFRIEPAYDSTAIDGKRLAYKTVKQGTGVCPGKEYYVTLLSGETVVATTKFATAAAKSAVPNAGMDNWCDLKVEGALVGGTVPSPNKEGDDKFWASGNNGTTSALCTNGKTAGCNGAGCATLKGKTTLNVFAAGNIFTGAMDFGTGLSTGCGYARFGQKYKFTARPTALKVRINATLGVMDNIGSKDEDKGHVKGTTKDVARVLFCITDWCERHTVQGGVLLDKNTFWNPAEQSSVAEGKILGYGLFDITEDTAGWKEITIPVRWYDTKSKPADGNYSLVISAASSAFGDYLTGSTASVLSIEDFEWVY